VGDIITHDRWPAIKDGDDLVNEIASRRPGSSIRLGYMRDGKPTDATVTIGDLDKVFAEQGNPAGRTRIRTRRAMRAKPSWDGGSRGFAATAAKLHTPRSGDSVSAIRLICRPAGA
jgi:hypothetical protein